jgi:hypothetical protein
VSSEGKRWLFVFLVILWTAGFFIVVVGAGFVGPRPEIMVITLVYLALPLIAHRFLIRSSQDEV